VTTHKNTIELLQNRLSILISNVANFVKEVPIQHLRSDLPIEMPIHYWGEASPVQLSFQKALRKEYDEFSNETRKLLRSGTKRTVKRFQTMDDRMRMWIDLGFNWALSPITANNEKRLRSDGEELKKILNSLILTTSK